MKKIDVLKILILVFLILISKIFIINPIDEKKQLLKIEKSKIAQNISEVEEYKKQLDILKKEEQNKKRKNIFNGSDDILEVQNTISKIVKIQSIENIVEINEQGVEESNIILKFVGTYDDIFRVIDMLSSKGISDYIQSISLSKVSSYTSNPIPDIPELSNTDNNSIKFECTLKISKN